MALPDLLWVNPVCAMSCLLGFGTVFGTVFRTYRGEEGSVSEGAPAIDCARCGWLAHIQCS